MHNIKYDVKAYSSIKKKDYTLKQTLRRKKGICYQYSSLFVALCQNAGISAKEIVGYTRGMSFHEGDLFFEGDHSWNAVKLDSAWYLVDATWGSGQLQQKKRWFKELMFKWFKKPYIRDRYKFLQEPTNEYFLASPKKLIENHLPSDPNWQMLKFPISVSTFESNEWKNYTSTRDSLYSYEIDSITYLNRLNKYEYQSDLQYFENTAASSQKFNPKNHKLSGEFSFARAESLAAVIGSAENQLKSKKEAASLYKTASSQLRRHQKSAQNESRKISKTAKSRISNELKKPLALRIKRAKSDLNSAGKSISREERTKESYARTIYKLDNQIMNGYSNFSMPSPARTEKIEVVEKNNIRIERNQKLVDSLVDSIMQILPMIDSLVSKKRELHDSTLFYYKGLPNLLVANASLIMQDYGITQISGLMHQVNSKGIVLDRVVRRRISVDQTLRQHKTLFKQIEAEIGKHIRQMQSLIVQSCQLSKNKTCDSQAYNKCNSILLDIKEERLKLEQAFLKSYTNDLIVYKELNNFLPNLIELAEKDMEFIALFEAARLGGITFKLKRSNYETQSMINDSNQNLKKLSAEIQDLTQEIRKSSR